MYSENIFCQVSMGDQKQVTDVCKNNTQNGNVTHTHAHNGTPAVPSLTWHSSMQFFVKNINEDNLVIVVYEKGLFTPDGKSKTAMNLFIKVVYMTRMRYFVSRVSG